MNLWINVMPKEMEELLIVTKNSYLFAQFSHPTGLKKSHQLQSDWLYTVDYTKFGERPRDYAIPKINTRFAKCYDDRGKENAHAAQDMTNPVVNTTNIHIMATANVNQEYIAEHFTVPMLEVESTIQQEQQ